MPKARKRLLINGLVQGVGFRPFVYQLAQRLQLHGFVRNQSEGVLIEVEGETEELRAFQSALVQEAPALSYIISIQTEDIAPSGEKGFTIDASTSHAVPSTFILPDIAVCDDCLAEMLDPGDRRYGYAFISCTQCGPRFTISHHLPYDRPNTTMAPFILCERCRREYKDPHDRRFHAQTNACVDCGPQLWLCDHQGHRLVTKDPIAQSISLLAQGKIIAVRGLGGFHLAVDARNNAAVQTLRQRKGRAEKPFAIMVRDLSVAETLCEINDAERKWLLHHTRPIVLLRKKNHADVAPAVAPNNAFLGIMLPYTPLHHLLLQKLDCLVMTSGNFSEEPIACGNEEALSRLAAMADYFLLHDREILQRCDDSIIRVIGDEPRLLRRARGFVPRPIFLNKPLQKPVLACGGELKNTIALSRGNAVFLSQHLGDLDNPLTLQHFEATIAYFKQLLQIEPEIIAHDLHPDYLATQWALRQKHKTLVAVQHHHAHLAAVLAENGFAGPAIGLILDGTGYGSDGTIWGGEVLIGQASGYRRFACLEPVAMPGSTAAIRQPWRMALSYLIHAYGEEYRKLDLPMLRTRDHKIVHQMIAQKINSPLTSSCGRLFDGVAALLGLRDEVHFEAQAAIELEMLALDQNGNPLKEAIYPPTADGAIPIKPLIRALVEGLQNKVSATQLAADFHVTLAELFLKAIEAARQQTDIHCVALSGGVFQNSVFTPYMEEILRQADFSVLTHKLVPCNDGGIALGQIAVADAIMHKSLYRS